MDKPELAIIDYGVGNLLSVRRGFEYWGMKAVITSDPDVIYHSARIVLPGVGAFSDGIVELRRLGFDYVLRQVAARGTPILGICLGMQMLLDESEEFGHNAGIGLIPGRVVPIPFLDSNMQRQKIPHIGWSALHPSVIGTTWNDTILEDIIPGESVYFVHSFMAEPANESHRIGDCLYGGVRIAATINRDNVHGCQFHPEKSGAVGLRVLKKFLSA